LSNQQLAFQHLQSAEKLHAAGRLSEAETACREALTLGRLGRYPESLQVLRQAAHLQPNSAIIRQNFAFALKSNGLLDEAMIEFQHTLTLDPNLAAAHSNLGILHKDLGRIEEAKACYRRAIQLKPDYADAHWNLALVLLRQGEFREGFAEYEWRKYVRNAAPVPNLPMPQWKGEELNGKTILLYPEQGLGDVIQFVRYIPMIVQRGGCVVVACPPTLRRILEPSFPMAQFIDFSGKFPPIDVQCSIISLPLAFGTDLNSIPASVPYLKTDPALILHWSARLGERDGRPRVGIVWAGNPAHYNDRNRSIALSELDPLLKKVTSTVSIPPQTVDVTFFSLQKERRPGEVLPAHMTDFTAELSDFADTAALISNLDFVITVDTSVAHLAGAIAKPTWVLLPFVTDWRWLLDRDDSPWYPTLRLFRQTKLASWREPVEQVVRALADLKPA
jgi:tetratricopeptide (TPR) repeat protein